MKRTTAILLFIFVLAAFAPAQTYISQQSAKQGSENALSITSNAGAQTGITMTGYASLFVTVSGTYGSVAFKAEGSTDGSTYTATPLPMIRLSDGQKITTTGSMSNTVEQYVIYNTGFQKIRLNITAWSSGTAAITQTPIAYSFTPNVIVSQATAANLNATVTGTVAATQSGTWNVTNISGTISLPTGAATAAKQPALGTAGSASSDVITVQGIASMTALKVDGSAVTQPISAASLPLPSGAATAAKQPALGTAGSASADVLTVQGIASMTAIKVDGSAVTQPVSGTVSITANSAVNVAQVNGVAPSMGNGVSDTGVQRVTIASDSTGQVALASGSNTIGALTANQSVNLNQIGGNSVSAGNGASGTGVQRVTIANDSTGVIQPIPGTSGGLSISATQSAASTNSTSVKGSAGMIYNITAINTTATLYYLRLYNSSSAPTCSSATGFIATYPIPASTSGGGVVVDTTHGIVFGTGIGFCITGGGSSTDNTNAATGVFVNILYK